MIIAHHVYDNKPEPRSYDLELFCSLHTKASFSMCYFQNQESRNEDLSEDWDIEGRKSEKRRRRVDDSDEDDEEPVGSVHKKHRITNIENFLDDEADDDDDDPEVSISRLTSTYGSLND